MTRLLRRQVVLVLSCCIEWRPLLRRARFGPPARGAAARPKATGVAGVVGVTEQIAWGDGWKDPCWFARGFPIGKSR